jgi:hypothetical protein
MYGPLALDMGLAGFGMPGPHNLPQSMQFDVNNSGARVNWFRAEGIPIMPFDDAGHKNTYPLMRLIARNHARVPVATNDIVLPVSDEMDCRLCHASGTVAIPGAGWVWASNPERDYRLNILRLHDEHRSQATYPAILTGHGYNAGGLYQSVVMDGKPVVCAACHRSEALPTSGSPGIPPLTTSVHSLHAFVFDPVLHVTLNNSLNREACYRCHPGSTTRCLRGAMGSAIAADGSMAIQCQSCHGSMSAVGAATRTGWLNEPTCQSCHTGDALQNNGQIRYTSSLTTNGELRAAVNQRFATNPDTPGPGFSLYRFSSGHGGLQCSACHGSTHAEFASLHPNDNLSSVRLQGHVGMVSECTACHVTMPKTVTGGPHGMHPVGQAWVKDHHDAIEHSGVAQCQVCHGTDYRGTVLSRVQADRTFVMEGRAFDQGNRGRDQGNRGRDQEDRNSGQEDHNSGQQARGAKQFWRGFQVGCYNCHNGPFQSAPNRNAAAVVQNVSASTFSGQTVQINLPARDANGNTLTLRIVSQPDNGSVGLSNRVATYFAPAGFVGYDHFTFAAWDGATDSNLGTGTVAVAQGPFSINAQPLVPTTAPQGVPATLGVVVTPSNIIGAVTAIWNFGDGSPVASGLYVSHTYATTGTLSWSVVSRVVATPGGATASITNTGNIEITAPLTITIASADGVQMISWPRFEGDALLEATPVVIPLNWQPVTNCAVIGRNRVSIPVPIQQGSNALFRLRRLE